MSNIWKIEIIDVLMLDDWESESFFCISESKEKKEKLCENMWNYEDRKLQLLLQTVAELGVVIFNALDFGLKVISDYLTIASNT